MDIHKIDQIGEVKWKNVLVSKNYKKYKMESWACIHTLCYEAPKLDLVQPITSRSHIIS